MSVADCGPANKLREPPASDLQASQTRGGGGRRGATWNEMEYRSTPDKVAAYEEDDECLISFPSYYCVINKLNRK